MKRCILIVLFIGFSQTYALWCQNIGPQKGSLVIVGGNASLSPEIFEKFIELAGGKSAQIVVIPTANGHRDFGPAYQGRVFANFQQFGANNLSILHSDDRTLTDSDAFGQSIEEATGVWFMGGRQWRIADSYLGTKFESKLWGLLERGGVIGGSSAGATIQGSYLVRGDTESNTIMMGNHEKGFGFLKNTAIDQHLLRRNRQFDLIEVVQSHPELLGIGLDEGTAIVVKGNEFEVIGAYYVAIYDPKIMSTRVPFYLLMPGDRFDLLERKASRQKRSYEELEIPD